jgi:hypothetical protein
LAALLDGSFQLNASRATLDLSDVMAGAMKARLHAAMHQVNKEPSIVSLHVALKSGTPSAEILAGIQQHMLGPRQLKVWVEGECNSTLVVAQSFPPHVSKVQDGVLHVEAPSLPLAAPVWNWIAHNVNTTLHVWAQPEVAADDVSLIVSELSTRVETAIQVLVYGTQRCNQSCFEGMITRPIAENGNQTFPLPIVEEVWGSVDVVHLRWYARNISTIPSSMIPSSSVHTSTTSSTSTTTPNPTTSNVTTVSSSPPVEEPPLLQMIELQLSGKYTDLDRMTSLGNHYINESLRLTAMDGRFVVLANATHEFTALSAYLKELNASFVAYFPIAVNNKSGVESNATRMPLRDSKNLPSLYRAGSSSVVDLYCSDIFTDYTPSCGLFADYIITPTDGWPLANLTSLGLSLDAIKLVQSTFISNVVTDVTSPFKVAKIAAISSVKTANSILQKPQMVQITSTDDVLVLPRKELQAQDPVFKGYLPKGTTMIASVALDVSDGGQSNSFVLKSDWNLTLNTSVPGLDKQRHFKAVYDASELYDLRTAKATTAQTLSFDCSTTRTVLQTDFCQNRTFTTCSDDLSFERAFRMLTGSSLISQDASKMPVLELVTKEPGLDSQARQGSTSYDQTWVHHHLDSFEVTFKEGRIDTATMSRTYQSARGECEIKTGRNVTSSRSGAVVEATETKPGILFCKQPANATCEGFYCQAQEAECSAGLLVMCQPGFEIKGQLRYYETTKKYDWKFTALGECTRCTKGNCIFREETDAIVAQVLWPSRPSFIRGKPRIKIVTNITFDSKTALTRPSYVELGESKGLGKNALQGGEPQAVLSISRETKLGRTKDQNKSKWEFERPSLSDVLKSDNGVSYNPLNSGVFTDSVPSPRRVSTVTFDMTVDLSLAFSSRYCCNCNSLRCS